MKISDIYDDPKLNKERIAEYIKLKELFNVSEGTLREVFCAGAEWAIRKANEKARIMKTFCVEVQRESEEQYTFHFDAETRPTREEVIGLIDKEEINYNDNYERFEYYQIN